MFSKKLNIAMIGHKRIPSREGGVEIVVEELSTRMVKKGNNVVCYNRRGKHISGKEFGHKKAYKEYKGVKIRTIFAIDKKGIAAVTSSFAAAIDCIFRKYDVVHFHAEGPCAAIFIPHLFGIRTVATIHGLDWARAKWNNGLGSKYIKFGEKMAVKYADEIIVLSKGVQQYFKETYNRDTVLIPNGVTKPEIVQADEISKKWGLKKDEYILFLGRIVPEKGIQYLIDAFKKVKTNKKLVIAGGMSDTIDFMAYMKKTAKCDDRIIFTGFVQGKVLDELYSNAYVYTLPSDIEGMPLSLLEALSYGNCCLTSDIAECADVIEDKGVTFKKSDVNDLTDKLQMLCDNSDVVEKYKSGVSDWICGKYNWDDVTNKTLDLYK